MSKIFHNLRNHGKTPSVSPSPQAGSAADLLKPLPPRPVLPGLPYEIWFAIIEMAIRPHLIVDLDFEPAQIEQAFLCLRTPAYGGERAAQRAARKVETNVKAVCKTWKEIVDVLNKNPKQWVVDQRYNNTKPPLINTSFCSRLNVEYYHQVGDISLKQSHPVSMVSVHSYSYAGRITATPMKSILDIISFPRQLKVLQLRFTQCGTGAQLLQELETNAVLLTTLSLLLNPGSVHLLKRDLNIPTLETLFLSIKTEGSFFAAQHFNAKWLFPRLRYLGLAEEDIEERKSTFYVTHPFISQLLQTHVYQIRALRAYPMFAELIDEASPSHWIKLPNLVTLSTDFYWLRSSDPPEDPPTKSTSIQHLIQIDMDFRNPVDIANGIESAIRACTRLESVSLAGPPFRYQKLENDSASSTQQKHNWWEMGAMKQLHEVCKDRRIELLNQEGCRLVKGS